VIINLTQHPATNEQIAQGVVDLTGESLARLKSLLTFDELPTQADVEQVAEAIANMASFHVGDVHQKRSAMIGGAPFLMPALDAALKDYSIRPLYAFSKRDSVEELQADGSVRKINVFRHAGFV